MKISKKDQEILESLPDRFIGDVIGVMQAVSLLKDQLDKVLCLVKNEEYEKASEAGYSGVSNEFIFLQRCLGGLNSTEIEKCKVIQNTAYANKVAYEEAEVEVTKLLKDLSK